MSDALYGPSRASGDPVFGPVYVAAGGATVPGAPTGVSATAGNAQALVSFSAPASNGGAAITGYTVTGTPGGSQSGASSPILVSGLTNGAPYTFTVHATNSVGNGPESAASNAVTPVLSSASVESNQFKIIRPTAINDARLISSTVPEADHSIWSIGPTFGVGNRYMMTTGLHTIYECLVPHTSTSAADAPNINLGGTAPKWLVVGPTNRWGMFDRKVGTVTSVANSLTVVLATGPINSLALLQVDAAVVELELRDGAGALVRTASMDLSAGTVVGNWYQAFHEPRYQPDALVITDLLDAALLDLPAYAGCQLTVTLRRPGGNVSCGVLVVGFYAEIGFTQWRPKVGIIDFSRKARDTFGNLDIVEREYAKRMSAVTVVDRAKVDSVTNLLAQYRHTLLVWIGAGNLFTCMIIYGFYKDWEMDVENYVQGQLSLQIEGMI